MYQLQTLMLHYADLPPIQFHDFDQFPWFAELESNTDVMRDVDLLAEGHHKFSRYEMFY